MTKVGLSTNKNKMIDETQVETPETEEVSVEDTETSGAEE